MSWLICGTVPVKGESLVYGQASVRDGQVMVEGKTHAVERGTPALVAAACVTAETLGGTAPFVLLADDTGTGKGSRALYAKLLSMLPSLNLAGITFHYLLPDVDWQIKLLSAIEALPVRPLLVADAGYMYAAKMSNCAPSYDLFTPDAGELAFLADEDAPHPFYTRGFLLADESDASRMIQRAIDTGGAARNMLVKGKTDYIVIKKQLIGTVDEPSIPAMEAVGGSGDTVAGIVTGLLGMGVGLPDACLMAAKVNRLMGSLAEVTPATQVGELLACLPQALRGVCPQGRPG